MRYVVITMAVVYGLGLFVGWSIMRAAGIADQAQEKLLEEKRIAALDWDNDEEWL